MQNLKIYNYLQFLTVQYIILYSFLETIMCNKFKVKVLTIVDKHKYIYIFKICLNCICNHINFFF